VQLGNLSRKPVSILKVIHDEIIKSELGERILDEKQDIERKKTREEKNQAEHTAHVIIGKARDIPYKMAKCCEPTPETRKIVGAIGQ
jgi:(p)ppGpp synthase/HD superfamily hydrolase